MKQSTELHERRIKTQLNFDPARLWERWYSARVSGVTRAEPSRTLAEMLTREVGVKISADDAGRAKQVLSANDDAMALDHVRTWLFTNAFAELLEAGIDGKVSFEVVDPECQADLDVGAGFVTVLINGWRLRFNYDMGCREGLEDLVLPGESASLRYHAWDPFNEMRPDAAERLESLMAI